MPGRRHDKERPDKAAVVAKDIAVQIEDAHIVCTDCIHSRKNRSVIRNDPLSRSITSLASNASLARCAFDAELSPWRPMKSPAKTFTPAASAASPLRKRFCGIVSDSHKVV